MKENMIEKIKDEREERREKMKDKIKGSRESEER